MSQNLLIKWYGGEVLQKIGGKVRENVLQAAEFATERAGALAPSRTGNLLSSMGFDVIKENGAYVGVIGVRRGRNAFYGRFVEMGTKFMRARPFLRPAVYDNQKEIMRIIKEGK